MILTYVMVFIVACFTALGAVTFADMIKEEYTEYRKSNRRKKKRVR